MSSTRGIDKEGIGDRRKVTMTTSRQDLPCKCPGLSDRYIVKGGFLWGKPIRINRRYQRCLWRTSCVPDRERGSEDIVGAQNRRA